MNVSLSTWNTACTAFSRTFVRLRTPHGHVSNVRRTNEHCTDVCCTFGDIPCAPRHVTRVNRRHPETTAFFEIRGQTSRRDQPTVQHWRSVHDCDSLDSDIVRNCRPVHDSNSFDSKTTAYSFCNLTPHIFTRTQCSFINNTASLCRLEDYNKTWFLPGVPRDTF